MVRRGIWSFLTTVMFSPGQPERTWMGTSSFILCPIMKFYVGHLDNKYDIQPPDTINKTVRYFNSQSKLSFSSSASTLFLNLKNVCKILPWKFLQFILFSTLLRSKDICFTSKNASYTSYTQIIKSSWSDQCLDFSIFCRISRLIAW